MDSDYIPESNAFISQNNYEDSDYDEYLYDLPRGRKRINRRRQVETSIEINKPLEEYQFNEIFPGVNINAPIKINRINSVKKNVNQIEIIEDSPSKKNLYNNEPITSTSINNIGLNHHDNSLSNSLYTNDTNENDKDSTSSIILPKSSNNLKLKKRITPTLLTSNHTSPIKDIQNSDVSNNHIENEKNMLKKNKDDFLPIVDIETENRLKLLPKPIYKYIPRLPISSNSVVGKKSSNRKREGRAQDFIQFVEPSEKELLSRIEYDMDEQDMVWLNKINNN